MQTTTKPNRPHARSLALAGLLTFFMISTSPAPGQPTTILPIGDSRVRGLRPEFESYRFQLWRELTCIGGSFDLVGPFTDDQDYPLFQGLMFDRDHASTGGWTTDDVLDNFSTILGVDPTPDVVLLGIGGNDMLQRVPVPDALENISQIIDQLRASNPTVAILIELIAPGLSQLMIEDQLTESFDALNAGIEQMDRTKASAQSPLIVVDMNTGWQDAWLADDVHYNETGAGIVAQRYIAALRQLRLDSLTPGAPCGFNQSTCDRNNDGDRDIFDAISFLSAWQLEANQPGISGAGTDVDQSGITDVGDLLAFFRCIDSR